MFTSVLNSIGFTDREVAAAIWLLIGTAFFLIYVKNVRLSVIDFVKSWPKYKIVWLILFLASGYVSLQTYLFWSLEVWHSGLLTITIFWLFGSAFSLLFKVVGHTMNPGNYIKQSLYDGIKFATLLTIFVNLGSYHLIVELLLFPFLFVNSLLLSAAPIIDAKLANSKSVVHFFTFTLLILAAISAIPSIELLRTSSDIQFLIEILREVLVPILYGVTFLPFLYGLYVYSAYDQIFSQLNILKKKDLIGFKKAKVLLLKQLGFRYKVLRAFLETNRLALLRARSYEDICKIVEHENTTNKKRANKAKAV